MKKINFTRIKCDTYGNPRLVCHFLDLLTNEEWMEGEEFLNPWKYKRALWRAHKIGGRKFHNRQFGGGIAFQHHGSEEQLQHEIEKILKS